MNFYLILYFFAIIFLETFIPKFGKIHLTSLLHSTIVGCSTNYLLLTDTKKFMNIYKYNNDELSSLYYYIPYYTLIFLFVDIKVSLEMKHKVFILHGFMMCFSTLFCIYYKLNHYLSVGLILEVSTIFYNLMNFDSKIFKILFGIVFLLYRNIIFASICINYLKYYYDNEMYYEVKYNILLIQLVIFNFLNYYWEIKY